LSDVYSGPRPLRRSRSRSSCVGPEGAGFGAGRDAGVAPMLSRFVKSNGPRCLNANGWFAARSMSAARWRSRKRRTRSVDVAMERL